MGFVAPGSRALAPEDTPLRANLSIGSEAAAESKNGFRITFLGEGVGMLGTAAQ